MKTLKKISLRSASEFLSDSELKRVLGGGGGIPCFPDGYEWDEFLEMYFEVCSARMPCNFLDIEGGTGDIIAGRCSKHCACVPDPFLY